AAVRAGGAQCGRRAAGTGAGARGMCRCPQHEAAPPAGSPCREDRRMTPQPLSIPQLVMHASPVVQLVLAMLAIASITSWAIILAKRSVLARSRAEADHFETAFWSGGDLGTLYRTLET